ncbi:ABC transporter [Shewanella sp. NFH-SH190041]|uniref:metal ABC transporter permease n=1 Tax=Shewanella sp. NFH-SH190041 TaxID=2950245 RepID=UPI0021C42B24|nr:metal ABC transporter permease [Shewanella sp. NFH-SH190041]BDM63178.1 ABC transporter [Shewanella sp. NFH-SH190041]
MTTELLTILLPALAAGLLILTTHVLLGRQVLRRGIIFIDLAIAQVAALGSVIMHLLPEPLLPGITLLLPTLAALGAAALIAWLEKHLSQQLEAIIGCLYVLAAAMAVLLLAQDPHGAEILTRMLDGQILWLSWSQLMVPTLFSAGLLLLLWRYPALLQGRWFYLLFALLITQSVSLVGVYLVFSSLIMPALAIQHRAGRYQLLHCYLIGVLGYLVGLVCSALWDLPSGATIVVALAIIALLYAAIEMIFSQQRKRLTN